MKKFFVAGIKRIVDQGNPQLGANFVPKIGEVVYKFMGVELKLELRQTFSRCLSKSVTSVSKNLNILYQVFKMRCSFYI